MPGTAVDVIQPSTENTALNNGFKLVAVLGTDEPLAAASTPIIEVLIQALPTNAGAVYIGGENVPNTGLGGIILNAGQTVSLTARNLTDVFVNSDNNGEGATFIYW